VDPVQHWQMQQVRLAALQSAFMEAEGFNGTRALTMIAPRLPTSAVMWHEQVDRKRSQEMQHSRRVNKDQFEVESIDGKNAF
jgi:hypothetical protein